jgi:hypothetical protein
MAGRSSMKKTCPPRGQALGHQSPEPVEAIRWDVRKPKREEDRVVTLDGAPGEQVSLDIAHARVADLAPIDRKNLR